MWRRAAITIATVAFVLWAVPSIVLTVFAACLVAIAVDAVATPLASRARIPRIVALLAVVTAILAGMVATVLLAGPSLSSQMGVLAERIPNALDRVEQWAASQSWLAPLVSAAPSPEALLEDASRGVVGQVTGLFTGTIAGLAGAMIVLIMGVYLAWTPGIYVRGLLAIVPPAHRGRCHEVLGAIALALRWWLVGRFSAMALVAVLTALGLTVIGVGPVIVLALIAGVLTFVPYLGPILALVPAVLVASTEDGRAIVSVVALYGLIQFIENNAATPLIQNRAVALPPAALIAAQLLMGVLFGLLGILLATPLAVALIVAVQMLWVQDALDTDVQVLGANHKGARTREIG